MQLDLFDTTDRTGRAGASGMPDWLHHALWYAKRIAASVHRGAGARWEIHVAEMPDRSCWASAWDYQLWDAPDGRACGGGTPLCYRGPTREAAIAAAARALMAQLPDPEKLKGKARAHARAFLDGLRPLA
jgi:hypothetical protein